MFTAYYTVLLCRVCVGSVLQANRGPAAGVSELLRFQRGLQHAQRGHEGKRRFHSYLFACLRLYFGPFVLTHCYEDEKRQNQVEDFLDPHMPY